MAPGCSLASALAVVGLAVAQAQIPSWSGGVGWTNQHWGPDMKHRMDQTCGAYRDNALCQQQVSLDLRHPVTYSFNYLPNHVPVKNAPAPPPASPPPAPAAPPPPACPDDEGGEWGWWHHHKKPPCRKHPWPTAVLSEEPWPANGPVLDATQAPEASNAPLGHRRALKQNLVGGAVQLLNDTITWVNNRLQGDTFKHGPYVVPIDYTLYLPRLPPDVDPAIIRNIFRHTGGLPIRAPPPMTSPALADPSLGEQASAEASSVYLTYPTDGNFTVLGLDFNNFWFYAYMNNTVTGIQFVSNAQYTVILNPGDAQHFYLYCYNDPYSGRTNGRAFTWKLNNATIMYTDGTAGGTMFQSCQATTISGPGTFYYPNANASFTQGNITAISSDMTTYTMTVDPGYPTDNVLVNGGTLLAIEWNRAARALRTNTTDLYPTGPATLNPDGSYSLTMGYPQPNGVVGDIITVRCGGFGNHMWVSYDCTNMTFSSITGWNPTSFFIYEQHCSNSKYTSVKLQPYPYVGSYPSPGTLSIQSGLADALHSNSAFVGPTVTSSSFINNGDDGIAIHANFYLVMIADPANSIITIASGSYYPFINVGDTVNLKAGGFPVLAPLGQTTVTAISDNPFPNPTNYTSSNTMPTFGLAYAYYYNLTVTTVPASLGFDCVLADPVMTGNGYTLTSNTISNNRGRGMLIKAGSGAITSNTITNPKFWGIQMTPELYWTESSFAENVTIKSNTISSTYGGLLLGHIQDDDYSPGQFLNHKNIAITGNTFSTMSYAPLIVNSVTNATITSNKFTNNFCYPNVVGQGFSWLRPANSNIFVTYTSSVTISGNTFSPGSCRYGPPSAGPHVSQNASTNVFFFNSNP